MKLLYSVALIVFITACNNKKPGASTNDHEKAVSELMEADRSFSAFSEENGMKSAFLEYLDSNGVLLRTDHRPMIGATAVDFLSQQDDTDFTITWSPSHGEVARSGEMGYTYGTYSIKYKANDSVLRGTYVSIWKKQADGSWRYVLDSGNTGVEE